MQVPTRLKNPSNNLHISRKMGDCYVSLGIKKIIKKSSINFY